MVANHASFTVGLIADDLTGANDAAVQFARRGWRTLIVLGSDPLINIVMGSDTSLSLVALTTDSRALDRDAAAKATASAVARMSEAGVDRVFLKIDSTMRGSVPGQIAGALSAWRNDEAGALAVVCPAYPQMGRTVVENHVLIDGQRVELSAMRRDRITPVETGDLAELIPGSIYLKKQYHVSQTAGGKEPVVMTFDAATDDDLAALARAIETGGRPAIPVGSAGLAGAMAEAWSIGKGGSVGGHGVRFRELALPPQPRILVQVTSLNPVALAQVNRLSAAIPDVAVLAGQAEEVAMVFNERVEAKQFDIVGLIGGDGARAALARLGASAIQVIDSVLEGVPLGIIVGGHADGMPVFTKSGGFGAEDALVRIVERFRT